MIRVRRGIGTVTASRHGFGSNPLLKLGMRSQGSDGSEDQAGAGVEEEKSGVDQAEESLEQDGEPEYTPYEAESDAVEYPILLWTVLVFGLGIAFGRCTVRR